jgi:hypothetical protein
MILEEDELLNPSFSIDSSSENILQLNEKENVKNLKNISSCPSPIIPPHLKVEPVPRTRFLLLDVRIDGFEDCHIKYGLFILCSFVFYLY